MISIQHDLDRLHRALRDYQRATGKDWAEVARRAAKDVSMRMAGYRGRGARQRYGLRENTPKPADIERAAEERGWRMRRTQSTEFTPVAPSGVSRAAEALAEYMRDGQAGNLMRSVRELRFVSKRARPGLNMQALRVTAELALRRNAAAGSTLASAWLYRWRKLRTRANLLKNKAGRALGRVMFGKDWAKLISYIPGTEKQITSISIVIRDAARNLEEYLATRAKKNWRKAFS